MIWMIFIKHIEKCNLNKERKILIILDDMIVDILTNKKPNPIVNELFIRRRKLNISLVFIKQSHIFVSKYMRISSTHFVIIKILEKLELHKIQINHSSDIDFYNDKNN